MRSAIIAFFLGLLAWVAAAQEAGINSPINRAAIAKYRIEQIHLTRTPQAALVEVARQDSSNNTIDSLIIQITANGQTGCPAVPSQTPTVVALVTAMVTSAANETGTDIRRVNFRVLTYLSTTTGCITGITLVP